MSQTYAHVTTGYNQSQQGQSPFRGTGLASHTQHQPRYHQTAQQQFYDTSRTHVGTGHGVQPAMHGQSRNMNVPKVTTPSAGRPQGVQSVQVPAQPPQQPVMLQIQNNGVSSQPTKASPTQVTSAVNTLQSANQVGVSPVNQMGTPQNVTQPTQAQNPTSAAPLTNVNNGNVPLTTQGAPQVKPSQPQGVPNSKQIAGGSTQADPSQATTEGQDNLSIQGEDAKTQSDANPNPSQSMSQDNVTEPFPMTPEVLQYYGTKYEVKCEETFAYYEAYVIDYNENTGKAIVAYENDWKPRVEVSLDNIRPCPPNTDPNWSPQENDPIECKAKAEESEPYGWWLALVGTVKDNLYLIRFEGWDTRHDQILELDMLRPLCATQNYPPETVFRRKVVQSQKDFEDQMRQNPSRFAEEFALVQNRTNLFHMGYNKTTSEVILVGTEEQLADAEALLAYLWQLHDRFSLDEKRKVADAQRLQQEYDALTNCQKVTFKFEPRFTKYVIGKQRSYVQKAQDIPGVKHVQVSEGECVIFADDSAAAQEAKEILELSLETVDIPSNCYRELIGRGGENIKELENNAKVMKISSLERYCRTTGEEYNPEEEKPHHKRMVIFGPKVYVAIAKSLLLHEVNVIAEKDKWISREHAAKEGLREYRYSGGGRYPRQGRYDEEDDRRRTRPRYNDGETEDYQRRPRDEYRNRNDRRGRDGDANGYYDNYHYDENEPHGQEQEHSGRYPKRNRRTRNRPDSANRPQKPQHVYRKRESRPSTAEDTSAPTT